METTQTTPITKPKPNQYISIPPPLPTNLHLQLRPKNPQPLPRRNHHQHVRKPLHKLTKLAKYRINHRHYTEYLHSLIIHIRLLNPWVRTHIIAYS